MRLLPPLRDRTLPLPRVLVATTLAVACGALAVACGSITRDVEGFGESDGALPPNAAARCGLTWFQDDGCGDCLVTSCCDEATACAADERCAAAMGCVGMCAADDDPASCRSLCLGSEDTVESQALLAPVIRCLAEDCDADCPACGIHGLAPTSECEECIERTGQACDTVKACLVSSDCNEGILCYATCNDPICNEDCIDRQPAAHDLDELRQILKGACAGACGYGSDWSCVNAYPSGGRDAQTAEVRVILSAFLGGSEKPDALVKACSLVDLTCESPLAEGRIDADGGVTLSLDLGHAEAGFDGYFEVTGEVEGAPLLPTLVHFPNPIRIESERRSLFISSTNADMMAVLLEEPLGYMNPERGYAVVTGHDCGGNNARNVIFESSPQAAEGEPVYGAPNMLPDSLAEATTAAGVGFFINFEPGEGGALHTFVMRDADSGEVLGRRRAVLRKGYGSNLFISPSPSN